MSPEGWFLNCDRGRGSDRPTNTAGRRRPGQRWDLWVRRQYAPDHRIQQEAHPAHPPFAYCSNLLGVAPRRGKCYDG
jgi:hypothetical protein